MSLRAPIGNDDFAHIRRQGLVYVDKTRLVEELLDDGAMVVLLPRPRRFGKTTNLSMLRYFFERPVPYEDRSDLFQDLAVWGSERCRVHFQRYPVISITLKEIKAESWELFSSHMAIVLAELYGRHRWLLDDPSMADLDRELFLAVHSRGEDPSVLSRSLLNLCRMLHRATGERVVLLIDEYDTPIHAGWLNDDYRKIIDFFRVFLGASLKGNPHLFKGVLTGILRVSKESIFSDINHLAVYSLLRERYSAAFGFTEAEVVALAEAAGATDQLPTMRRWYNGYRVGKATVYNPWSVLCFLSSEDFRPRPYWVNTSSNELVGRLITGCSAELSQELERVLAGGKVRVSIDEGLVMSDLEERSDSVWTLLLFAGYLKPATIHRDGSVTLAVPNREVMSAYDSLLQRWLQRSTGGSGEVNQLTQAMLRGDAEEFQARFGDLVRTALSFHDLPRRDPERVYHAFTLGLLVQLRATHRVESNPESGYGRADVLVTPRKPGRPGVVLEFKRLGADVRPEVALEAALAQIEQRAYTSRLVEAGASPIWRYAVVFDGKAVHVRT